MQKPYLVIEWNDTLTDAKGWLVVHNFVKGYTGGGTRMHPTVTREEVERLALGMGYKYNACESTTTGGCKGGIVYDYRAPDATDVLKRYLIAMMPYIKAGVSLGEDLGTRYDDVLSVFKEFGFELPQTKSMENDPIVQKGIKDFDAMMGEKVDGLFINDVVTGYGVAFSADEAWKCMDGKEGAKVVIQGFGSVGAGCALKLSQLGYKIVGISDANLLVSCDDGLDVQKLIDHKNKLGEMDKDYFEPNYEIRPNSEWLDVECDILIPAALEDVINEDNVDKVKASLIVEGANIPISPEADKILKQKNKDIVVDFIANLGAIRFYDVIVFGLIEPKVELVIDDIEKICRKNTKKLFEESKKQNRYQRDIALEMFAPTVFDAPEV